MENYSYCQLIKDFSKQQIDFSQIARGEQHILKEPCEQQQEIVEFY